ncbi:MAG: DUF424 family protein [Candidatus Micrarchaeota archaeon]
MKGKIHRKFIMEGGRQSERRIVAICDAELLGNVFEEGDLILDLKKYRSFYEGERVTVAKVIEMVQSSGNINLVGKKAIAAASKAIAIDEKSIMKIKGVPHLQIYQV